MKKMKMKIKKMTTKMKAKKVMKMRTKMRRIVKKMRIKDMKRMKVLLMRSKTNKKPQRNQLILTITSQSTMMNQNLYNTLILIPKRKSLKRKRQQELLLKKQRPKVENNFPIKILILSVETKKGKGKKKSKKEKAKRKKRREPKPSEGVVLEDVFVNKRYVYGAPFTDFHQFYFKGDYLDFDPDEFFRVELVNEKGGLTNVIISCYFIIISHFK